MSLSSITLALLKRRVTAASAASASLTIHFDASIISCILADVKEDSLAMSKPISFFTSRLLKIRCIVVKGKIVVISKPSKYFLT